MLDYIFLLPIVLFLCKYAECTCTYVNKIKKEKKKEMGASF